MSQTTSMTYKEWYIEHSKKRQKLINSLIIQNFSKEEIVHYFRWSNMVKNQPQYCGLYSENKKCHQLNELNCLYCACPYFIFNDEGIETIEENTIYSKCTIDSRFGTEYEYDNCIHQDCSLCLIPHTKQFSIKYFENEQIKQIT